MRKINLLVLLFSLAIVSMSFGQSRNFSDCSAPENLFANQLTGTSATLNWTPNGKTFGWDIEVGSVGFTPGSNNFLGRYFYYQVGPSISSYISYGLTGLEPNSKYAVYIRTSCPDGQSEWVGPAYFLTDTAITIGTIH